MRNFVTVRLGVRGRMSFDAAFASTTNIVFKLHSTFTAICKSIDGSRAKYMDSKLVWSFASLMPARLRRAAIGPVVSDSYIS